MSVSRPARVATPSRSPVGKVADKRRKWYPVDLLASQSMRPVSQIVGWLESGKLRGFNSSNGWIVHRDQLDVWRELCRTQPAANVYRSMHQLLSDHPDLEPLHQAMRDATLAPSFDPKRLDRAKAAWERALAERGIRLEFGQVSIGHAGHDIADPGEPGFEPIDRHRYGSEFEMNGEHA